MGADWWPSFLGWQAEFDACVAALPEAPGGSPGRELGPAWRRGKRQQVGLAAHVVWQPFHSQQYIYNLHQFTVSNIFSIFVQKSRRDMPVTEGCVSVAGCG